MLHARPREQYDKLCLIYDSVFSSLLDPGRREVIAAVNRLPRARVLEVGIGTGLSLPLYDESLDIVGVDISASMLRKAEARRRKGHLHNVRLMQMDAEKLAFADNSFDAVVALYVVSTTRNPQRMMQELSRVCRPEGRIYILNHFTRAGTFMERVEKWVLPVTRRIGWHSHFEPSNIWHPSLQLTRRQRLNCFGYWQLLEFSRA